MPFGSPDLALGSTLTDESLATADAPDLVCLSKPDIYDSTGKIDNYLRAHDFKVSRTLPAFQLLEQEPVDR